MKNNRHNSQAVLGKNVGMKLLIALVICLTIFVSVRPVVVLAADQTIGGAAAEGNLRILVTDSGKMGVERYMSGVWQSQVYSSSPGSKGSKLFYDNNHYFFGYYETGSSAATNVSNTTSGSTITTSWTAGPSMDVTQKTTYVNGNSYYRLEWNIYNRTGSTINDLRFFHGQDTYLSGDDKGAGFYDAANNAVGVSKTVGGVQQRMTLQGVTTPFAYESRRFSDVNASAAANQLTNTLDPNPDVDNGYALEWRRGSLGAYSTWTIVAFEKFNNASVTGLSVTAPAGIECQAGNTCAMNFSVENMGESASNVSLSASSSSGWSTWVSSPSSPVNIGPGASQAVTVQVSVPAGSGGSMSNVTLTANDGTNTSSETGGVTATIPPYIAPTAFTSGAPGSGTYGAAYSHTFTANGTPAPSYSIVAGSVPTGLSLNSGILSGTPSAYGTYNFTVRASNPGGTYDMPYTVFINKANTSLTITGNTPNPSVYGQTYTVSARVDSQTSGTPSGTVSVSDGVNPACTITLSGGSGSCTLPSSSVAPKTITAAYGETTNFYGSSSTTGHTTNTATTTTTSSLTSSTGANLVYGQPFTLSANVASQYGGAVTGTVQFQIDGVNRGSALSTNGSPVSVADIQDILVSETPHTYRTSYSGDGNNYSSMDDGAFTVSKAPTTLTITSTDEDVVYGTTVDITVTVDADAPSLATPAGTVTMFIDGIQFGDTMTLDSSGQAVKTVPYLNLWPGDHQITAYYEADVDPVQYLDSDNHLAPFHQIVRKAPPTFELTPSVAELVTGEPVGFAVTVGPSMETQGIPTGKVQFLVDSVPLGGLVTLNEAGEAVSPALAHLSATGHSISVTYSGNDYFLPNPSAPLLLSVGPADTITTITGIGSSTAVVGEPVSVMVKVEPAAPATGVPTGNVDITNGTNTCQAALDEAGEGSCLLRTSFTSETTSLTATYLADSNYLGSVSEAYDGPEVSKASTTVQIDSFSPVSPVVGQMVQFNFSAAPVAPGNAPLSGMVTVRTEDGEFLCEADIIVGQCSAAFDAAGPTSLVVSYAGNSNLNGSTADAAAGPVVDKSPTATNVASSSATSVYGQPVHFTATVTAAAPGAGWPAGMVQFMLNGDEFGAPVALEDGSAQSEAVAGLDLGTHTFSAEYLGNVDFSTSTAAAQTQTVTMADSVVSLVSDMPSAPYGVSVWITATVVGKTPSEAYPTSGTVQFIVDTVPYGDPIALDENGQAKKQLPYTALWVGSHNISAVYSGSARFNGSTAATMTQVIVKGNVTFTVTPSAANPVFGQSLGFTGSVTGIGSNNPKPGGTLKFTVGGIELGTIALSGGQAASSTTTALPVGTHEIVLTYSGDAYYGTVANHVFGTITVARATTAAAITLVSPADAAVVGEPVAVTYTVTAAAPGSGTPSGDVTVTRGPDSCTASVAAGTCTIYPTTLGAENFAISYAGDDNFFPNLSGTGMAGPDVAKASVTAAVTTAEGGNVVVGEPYPVSASVTAVAPGTFAPEGETLVLSNGTDQCEAVIQSDGTAECDLLPTTRDPQSLTARFAGSDLFNGPVTSPAVNGPTVGIADVDLTIESVSASSVVVGEPYTVFLQMSAHAPSTTIPVGAVVTVSNGDENCEATVEEDGSAACEIVPSDLGAPGLTAAFAGSALYHPATSVEAGGPTVDKAGIDLSIPAPPVGPFVVGQSYQVQAVAAAQSPSTTIPVGDSITISNGTDECSAVIQNDGSATCSILPTSAGSPDLNAEHLEGSLYLAASVDGVSGPQINKGSILVEFATIPAGPFVLSEPYTVSAQAAPVAPGTTIPVGGIITISNGTDTCSAEIQNDGSAACSITPSSVGTPSLTATFAATDDYNSDSSPATPGPQINKANIVLSIPVPPAGTVFITQPYSVTALVEPAAPATEIPTGENLTLSNGINTCSAVIQSDGTAACSITPTTLGSPDVAATYGGSAKFNSKVSLPVSSVTVVKITNTIVITSPMNPSVTGAGVLFTATLSTDFAGLNAPTGQITFELDGEPLGSPVTLLNKKATSIAVDDLTAGDHTITAVYSGDSRYSASPEASMTQQVLEASIAAPVAPETEQTLTFEAEQDGQPVTTTITVPAGAVDRNVVMVYRQFTNSPLTPPTLMQNLMSFTLEVYEDGELVPDYAFDEPLRVTLTYYANGLYKRSIKVLGWNGSIWSSDGLVMEAARVSAALPAEETADTISFMVLGTHPLEYALVGSSSHYIYIPIITREAAPAAE